MVIPDVALKHLDRSRAARRRRFVLTMGMGNMMGMRNMDTRMGMGTMARSGMMGINGRAFEMDRIDERVPLGDVEIWEVSGEMMAHSFHVHGVQFEVLSRNGGMPPTRDQGCRDTVPVKEPIEILLQFTQPAAKSAFMYHCHILEHEDMGQFVTT